jgi:hypothetical protein
MKINLNKPPKNGEQTTTIPTRKGGVVIGKIKTERVFIDRDGNEINPVTKQIIKRNNEQ